MAEWWEDAPLAEPSVRPFKPGERIDNADGSQSTELTVTVPVGDKWANVPSLWMTPEGPQRFDEDQAAAMAQEYSAATGESFPSFSSVDEAVSAAKARSQAGGAGQGAITKGDWWESAPLADKAPAQKPPMKPYQGLELTGATTGMSPDASFARREAPVQPPQVMAGRTGIETEGAPQDLRNAYMKVPPQQREKYAEFMVNSYFQKRANGNSDHVPVRYDQGVDTHIFKDPADGKWKPLNDLGMDMEDAKDFMKYVVAPSVAAGGAGFAGTLTGSPALGGLAALSADAATAGSFRADDVAELVDAGLLPRSVSPGVEGAKEAAWSVAGFALGDSIGRAGRKLISGVDDIPMAVDVDRKMVNDMMTRYEKEYGDTMPNLTLDEKMGMVAKTPKERAATERVRSRRDVLRQSAESRKDMLDRQYENEEAFRSGLDEFLQVVGRQDDPGVFRSSGISADELLAGSSRIIDTLEQDAKTRLKQYDQSLARAYQDASQTFDDLLGEGVNPRRMPETLANALQASRETFRRDMDEQYAGIREVAGGQRIFDVAPLKQELRTIRSSLEADGKFRQLMEGVRGFEPRQVVRDGQPQPANPDDDLLEVFFGDSFRSPDSGIMVPDAVRRQRAEVAENYSYEDIDSALKTVRRRKRELPANTDAGVWATFGRVESALEDIRDAGLRGIDPELATNQQALDATYKIGMDALDRGLLKKLNGKFLEPRPGEPGLLKPSSFDALFKGDAGSETVRDLRVLANEDVFNTGVGAPIASLGVQDNVRKGLLGKLREQAKLTTGTGGDAPTVSPEAFAKFKNDYRDALEYSLKPGQIDRIENMTGMRRALESAEKDYVAAKKEIEQFPWGSQSIANDPTKLFRTTWKPAAEDPTSYRNGLQLREALRSHGDPEGLLTDYRKLIANDMMRQVQMEGSAGYVDPSKLRKYLDKHQEQLKIWYTSEGKSGTDLVENLKTYSDIGRTILETAGLAHADKDPTIAALNSVARAYVGVFTTPGRVLTAVKQLAGGASVSKEADFILNPEKYVKNQDFYEVLDSQAFRSLQRAGGHAVMQVLREDMGLPEQEPEVAPLFGQ